MSWGQRTRSCEVRALRQHRPTTRLSREIRIKIKSRIKKGQCGGGPGVVAHDSNVFLLRLANEVAGEEGHVFGFENAFVILVVSAFVDGERAGFGGSDRFASDGMGDDES